MPGLMMPKRRGIFGSAIPQSPLATEAVQPAAQPQKPKFFGEGGTGRNIAGHLGDALLQMAKMDPIYQPQMQRQQEMRYLEQRDAAKRQLDMADFRTKEDYRRAHPDPDYFDDNAGNRWTVNPTTGERKLVFRDPNQKMIPQKVTGPNGEEYIEYVKIPNMVNEDGTFQGASAPVSALPEGYSIRGAPGVSEAPRPTNTIARSAYDGWVNLYGKAEADAIMKRNGMTVGGY